MNTHAWVELGSLAAVGLAGLAALLVIALHLVRTAVDPWRDGVSGYALTRFGVGYRVQAVATGAAGLLLAFAVLVGGLGSVGGVAALVVFAIARILIARYPTDPRGTATLSRAGRIHVLLAATTFVAIAIAGPRISMTLADSADWHGPTNVVVGLGWATTLFAVGTFASTTLPATRRFFGLVERGAYAAWLCWIVIAGLGLSGRI